MTSSAQQQQQHHQAKFRWTENLTCRFIQLRKEHGKMFTGRKYSAQAGWEYILQQMREEFPTIMADVHYRVLKKKWSNLLQQYKELKNPVHGDKNKADDISWPFYTAIDEVLGNSIASISRRCASSANDEDEDDDDDLNPQEFLCVSVTPDNDEDEDAIVHQLGVDYNVDENDKAMGLPRLEPLGQEHTQGTIFDSERLARTNRRQTATRKRSAPIDSSALLSRLPRATELTIRSVRRAESEMPPLGPIVSVNGGRDLGILRDLEERRGNELEEDERPRKRDRKSERPSEERESRLESRIVEFMEYTKRRDEENRNIMTRMLQAIEDIRNAVA